MWTKESNFCINIILMFLNIKNITKITFSFEMLKVVLVQKLLNICKCVSKPGHTDTITPQKGRDQYEKRNFI
ncbi:hypothetical protein COJ60_25285 [Bacillus cereus]|nr:hypothetical protein COJ60_25285 [Bacillus cereus]RAT14362.1 hypothetical protein A6E22_00430 [Bacillus cereus]